LTWLTSREWTLILSLPPYLALMSPLGVIQYTVQELMVDTHSTWNHKLH